MNRRKFITLLSLMGAGGMAFLSTILFKKNRVLNQVHSIIEPVKLALKNIPGAGRSAAVETVFNSRCTRVFQYINWVAKKPTHSLSEIGTIENKAWQDSPVFAPLRLGKQD